MRSRPWKRKRQGRFYTILTDILINLLAFFMLLVGIKSEELVKTQDVAAAVPGLKRKVNGLRGDLDKAKIDLTKASRTGAKYKTIITDQKTKLDNLGTQLDGVNKQKKVMEGELKKIKKHFRAGSPVTLVVLIDLTNSMTAMIAELAVTMSTVFETLPQQSSDFRISILGLRTGVVEEFPITKIEPYWVDEGKSQESALSFIHSLTVAGANTEHYSVFVKAVTSLREVHGEVDPKRKERIIFLGDVGCSELDGHKGYSDAYNVDERAANEKIVAAMQRWTSRGDRAIVSLYLKSNNTKSDPGAAVSEAWFRQLGSTNSQSAFHTDRDSLLRAVLKTARD